MGTFTIWTAGCQMNQADSRHLAEALEQRGFSPVASPEEADLIVVNTCVVRQSAEDRATGYLTSLMPLKKPGRTIALMGCMVGPGPDGLRERFPYVDFFLRPGTFGPLLERYPKRQVERGALAPVQSAPFDSPVAAFVPVIEGCDHFCTYCIVPYRRGRQRSRPLEEISCEVETLVARGAREVTLLGQNVDAYGHDLPPRQVGARPDLSDLLARVHSVPGLARIRFLTSHPAHMKDKLIDAIARLPKVCPHFSLPVQAGDDSILEAMRRGYTVDEYRQLIQRIRAAIPQASVSTDVIVGFPGENEEQFQNTIHLLEELRFDKVHVAAYSSRSGTIAARSMRDDVPRQEKIRRLQAVEALQERVATEINAGLEGQVVGVLVEGQKRGKWYGRTCSDKLVFFPGEGDLLGQLVLVHIERTGPWSLGGVPSPSGRGLG